MEKFTNGQVQSVCDRRRSNCCTVEVMAVLRELGALVENKPLLEAQQRYKQSSGKTDEGWHVVFRESDIHAHQAALDKVRDGIQLVIAWLMESGDHMRAAHLQDTFNAAVREGCWTPEAP